MATRDFDLKQSGRSQELQVLRYLELNWDIQWADLAGYYYDAGTTDTMAESIRDVASFNGYTLNTGIADESVGGREYQQYGYQSDRDRVRTKVWSPDSEASRSDRNGNRTKYVYDEVGNLLQVIDPTGAVTDIQYNEFNKPKQITEALGNTTYLSYDSHGNLTSVTNALGQITSIQRDSPGNPTSITNGALVQEKVVFFEMIKLIPMCFDL